MSKVESYASVWDAIADTPEEAANLRARAELMQKIAAIVEDNGWTQAEAAKHCGVTQPRISDLLRGRVSRFSLDACEHCDCDGPTRASLSLKWPDNERFASKIRFALVLAVWIRLTPIPTSSTDTAVRET